MKYDVAIIGGGPAGYTAAERLAQRGKTVVIFEKENWGGVCLNEGCIPTKTLLRSAKIVEEAKIAAKFGVKIPETTVNYAKVVSRKTKVVRKLVLGIKQKLTNELITMVQGEATVLTARTIQCGEDIYECEKLMLCVGSSTFIPPVPGLDKVDYWTHKEALLAKELPKSLIVMGGGVIGMEFAALFHTMGVEVTVIEMLPEILGGMDAEIAAMLREIYTKRGIRFLLSTKVTAVSTDKEQISVTYEHENEKEQLAAERLLVSAGRRAITKGSGLEQLSLSRTERGLLLLDEHMQTSMPGVYACGDMTGTSMLAHTAEREAEVAVRHILGEKDSMSYQAIPGVVYTHPEVACVGATEMLLKEKNTTYTAVQLPMAYAGRFVAENEGVNGSCKLLVAEDQTLLGAHLLGDPSSEIITLATMAIEKKLTLDEWRRIVFPHPTVSEIFREAMNH